MDQIISCQISINGIVLPISICFLCGLQWMKDLSYFISTKGCYVGPFIVYFTCNYFFCHSFFLSLFRYICILHPEKTFRLGLNASKVSTKYTYLVPVSTSTDFNLRGFWAMYVLVEEFCAS